MFFSGEEEKEVAKIARRSIVAKLNLQKGNSIKWDDLSWLRPGGGLSPGEEEKIIGRTLTKNVQKGTQDQ